VHDTHHPIASGLYYEDQKREARRRSRIFLRERLPKFLRYFEREVERNFLCPPFAVPDDRRPALCVSARHGQDRAQISQAGAAARPGCRRPELAKVSRLGSPHPFNQQGIFRHYPELDAR
jgi:glutathione S-transferase